MIFSFRDTLTFLIQTLVSLETYRANLGVEIKNMIESAFVFENTMSIPST